MFPSGISPTSVNPGWGLGINPNGLMTSMLFCPPVFSILLIENVDFEIEQIDNLVASLTKVDNIDFLLSRCHDC